MGRKTFLLGSENGKNETSLPSNARQALHFLSHEATRFVRNTPLAVSKKPLTGKIPASGSSHPFSSPFLRNRQQSYGKFMPVHETRLDILSSHPKDNPVPMAIVRFH